MTKFHPAAQKAYDAQRQRKAQRAYKEARCELCHACEEYVLMFDSERLDLETEQELLIAAGNLIATKEALDA